MNQPRAMRRRIAVSGWHPARNHEHAPLMRPECFGRAGSNRNAVFVQAPIASSQEARPPKALRAFSFGTDRTGRVSSVPLTVAATEKSGVRVPGVSDWGPWTGSASQSRKRRKGVTAKAGGRVGLHEIRQPRLRDANRQHSEKHQQGRGSHQPQS